MSPQTDIGKIFTTRMQGKLYILKLQERVDRDEALTLDSPGVRQQVTDQLVNSRKQLLSASYQAIAMNEARVENYLAKQVVDNPNELSGARPAPAANAGNSNQNGSVTTPSPAAANTNANAGAKPVANTNAASTPRTATTPAARPAATTPAKPTATAGNANR
jgi:hypothetical protein